MTAYRYWGLRIPQSQSGVGGQVDIAELKLRDTPSGTNLALNKTTAASSALFPSANAVNGNVNDFWTATGTAPAGGHWILVDLGADYEIVEIEITVRNNFFRGGDPIECTLFWANSLTGIHDDYFTFPTQAAWSNGETRTLSVTGDGVAASGRGLQVGTLALASQVADNAIASQAAIMAVAAAETSSTTYDVLTYQYGMYALVRPNGDRRELRAWTFKQDDHEFYGLQLGAGGTLVYDILTEQWCQWKSPGYTLWRAEDVTDWEGFNLACDTESGKIWKIDPTGRLDEGTTPITSKIVGYLTHRFRKHGQCHMAELAVSEGQPPSGFEDGSVGITLRTSTDDGQSFVNHGEVAGEGIGEDMTARWYGLGLMKSPGMLFEITDTGYARRIDGLDIETNEDG